MSEEAFNPVQGMYAQINDRGVYRATVTMTDVSLTTYHEVKLFEFNALKVGKAFSRIAQLAGTNIQRELYSEDFTDLLILTEKTQKTTMCLRSGDKVHTYVVKQPVQREDDGFLELSPYREEWWTGNPALAPIVESIQSYLPDFAPWKMQLDPYIRLLSKTSGLM